MKHKIFAIAFAFLPFVLLAQSGPGGVGDTTGTSALKLWLMANKGTNTTTHGDAVSTWDDQSGADNNMEGFGTSNTAPEYRTNETNGLPGIRFYANQYFTTKTLNSTFKDSVATIFAVRKGAGTGTLINIGKNKSENEFLILNDNAYHHIASGVFTEWTHQCINSIPNDSVILMTVVFGSKKQDVKYFVNALLTTDAYTESVTGVPDYSINDRYISIGRRDLTGGIISEAFTGTIMEIIGYNKKLNQAQIDSVANYLQTKYNLKNNGCGNLAANKNLPQNRQMQAYPNPSTGLVQLQLPESGIWKIAVCNSLGQTIKQLDIFGDANAHTEISTPGLYWIQATNMKTGRGLPVVKILVQ